MYRDNPLKCRLRKAEHVVGCWLGMANPVAAEIVALAGVDFVMIDNEHGPASLTESRAMLQAIAATPAAGLMRVPWNDPVYVKRALDIGVEGLMFPAIGSAEATRAAVAACRYPPAGVRGVGYGMVRASDYGLARDRYPDTAADNLLIICQIESAEGVEAIPDIAAVPGVDMLFVGPYDLSASIGRLGRFGDPEVMALLARAERAILDSGRWYGSIPSPGRTVTDLLAGGCRLVIAGSDIGLLRDGVAATVRGFRAAAGTGTAAGTGAD